MTRPLPDNRCPGCVIADEKVTNAHRMEAQALIEAGYAREMAIVALRMLKRAGQLKPTTDDERAAVELAGTALDLPAANRRLMHPMTPDYSQNAVNFGQAVLFAGEEVA